MARAGGLAGGCPRGAGPARQVGLRGPMKLARVSLSLFALIGALAVLIAAATIWLMLSSPVTVADAVNEGQVTPLVQDLVQVLYEALLSLLSYL